MGLPLLLLLLLVTASCSGKSNVEGPSDNILALEWPINACQVNNWNADGCEYEYWTIHGWWPPKGGKGNNETFELNKIKDLQNQMETDWLDLSNKETFWEHEWDKHGKPATRRLTVYSKKRRDYNSKSNVEGPSDNILALEWPINLCQVKNWNADGCEYEYWTIHGWWPPKGGKGNDETFELNKIKDLQNQMKTDWPDLSNKKTFWEHEWDKHGKPATQRLTVYDYFKKGLDYYSDVKTCINVKPEEAKACFENLKEVVEKCKIVTEENLITEVRLYLK